ncbi:conserved hypothetical protein [Nitrosococcus watsonii C-113]|uniref:Uncharacterized protein n=1 Tax=Nitrosococcus watsoni (strain C-113) TaxID=105559 RepID=D8K7B6_NITWC|nr:conserved hypothetical protein [Nitrosococcus watsonii C-113]
MDKIFYLTIAIAVIGLTYLAYQRPEKYERLFNSLQVITFIVYACLSIWNTALTKAFVTLTPFIKEGQLKNANATLEMLQIPWLPLHIIMGSLFVYFLFLSFLPRIRQEKKKRKA